MAGIKVLVTGSTGFVGSHLCRELHAQGYVVRAFHRPTSSLRLLDGLEIEHVLGDLTQPDSIQAAVEGMDYVFHAAAWMGGHDPTGQQYAVTVEGTRNLLSAARKASVQRFVHTSSIAALGVPRRFIPGSGQPACIDEHHTWNYRPDYYPYGYAKYLAEQEVQKAVAQGLDAVIVNPTLVFGAGDIYRQAGSIITQVAERRLTIATEGGVNCVHIADVVDGHLAALKLGRTGERYILGGENLTLLQLVQMSAEVTGVPIPNLVVPAWLLRWFSLPAHMLQNFLNLPVSPELFRMAGTYFFFDLKKAETELGLAQHRPVRDALVETFDWFQQGKNKPVAQQPADTPDQPD
jgi:dihydroflavonol-4-reductase